MAPAAAGLAVLLAELFPYLAAFATALAGAAYLQGAGPGLYEALVAFRNAAGAAKFQAILTVKQILAELLSSPLTQASLSDQGAAPAAVAAQVEASVANLVQSNIPALTYPVFATAQEADQWYALWGEVWTLGLIARSTIDEAYRYYTGELGRLQRQAAEAAIPAPVPAPISVTPAAPTAPSPAAPTVPLAPTLPGAAPITVLVQPAPVSVAAPIVHVAPPQVLVQAPPAPQVQVYPNIDTTPIAGALVGALPLLATGIAEAALARAGPSAHAAQQARYTCQGSFLDPLLQVARKVLPGAVTGAVLMFDGPVRQGLDALVQQIITAEINMERFRRVESYDDAVANASTRLTQAVGFGLQAQSIAYTAEAITPLKQMGFHQLAGFFADLAGFQRIAAGLMGTIEGAAIYTPLKHQAQARFRPEIPALPDLEEMYAKKEIPFEAKSGILGLRNVLALHGLSDEWAAVYREHLWKDPRLGEVIRIGQFFNPMLVESTKFATPETQAWMERAGVGDWAKLPGDWYYAWRAAKGGYDPRDVAVLVETAKRATARREQTLFLDAITREYRDGYITSDTARTLVLEAWEFSDPITARMRAMELQRDYKLLSDTRGCIALGVSKGLLTRDEGREQLAKLGLDPQRVDLEILKSTLGMIPGMRISISRPEEVLEEAGLEAE